MIYRLRYCNKDGVEARVDIQKGSSTPVIEVEGTERPFILSYNNDKGNKSGMFLSSSADIEIYETPEFNIDNLKTSNETELSVTHYIDNVITWQGFIIPDFFSIEVRNNPVIIMTASDRLGTLKNVTLSDLPSMISLRELAVLCLNKTGLSLPLKTMADFSNGTGVNDFFNSKILTQRLSDTKGRSISCYDILSNILTASNSFLVQRSGAWHIINKIQHEAGSGKLYTGATSFTNWSDVIFNFSDINVGGRRTIIPVASTVGVFHEFGGGRIHPENYDFLQDLTGWNSVGGFVASIDNRKVDTFTTGGTGQAEYKPVYGDATEKKYLVNNNQYVRNVNPIYLESDPIPIFYKGPGAVNISLDINAVGPAVSSIGSFPPAYLRVAIIATNGTKTKTLDYSGKFIDYPATNPPVFTSQFDKGEAISPTIYKALLKGMSVSGALEVEDDLSLYSLKIRIYGGGGGRTVLINSVGLTIKSESKDNPKGIIYKVEREDNFTKAHEIDTSLFADYLTTGLNGYFYDYSIDDTSSLYNSNNELTSKWTAYNDPEQLPLLQHISRQKSRLFSVAHDLLSAEIEATHFDPLAIFVACEKRYTVVSAQFDFFKSNLSVELEEAAFQSATVRDFIYSYFGDGESGIKSVGGISGGTGGGGSTGGGLTPEQVEILSFWKKDPDRENTIFTEMNAYSKLELSAYGAGTGGGGGGSDYERLDTWADYDSAKAGWVLSAFLGNDLNTRVTTIDGRVTALENSAGSGSVTSVGISVPTGLSVSNSPITSSGVIAIGLQTGYSIPTTTKQGQWDTAYNNNHTHTNKTVLDGITSALVSDWNTAFTNNHTHSNKTVLDGITSGLISNWNTAYTNRHTHSNKAQLDLITQSNIDVLAKLSIVNGNLQIDGNAYATGELSAYGAGDGGGGGGGIIETVYGYGNLGQTFNNNVLTDTFNAYTINRLHERVQTLEDSGGGGGGSTVEWGTLTNGYRQLTVEGVTYALAQNTHKHLWADITDKPSTFTPSAHTHLWADITDKPSTFTPSAHTHSAGNITSGTFAIARIPTGTTSSTVAIGNHLHTGVYEPVFSKNTAFNKNFGTATGTVAQGNDSRIINGQTAFDWGNHATAGYALNSALSGYVPTSRTITAGNGLTGGGTLAADRTITLATPSTLTAETTNGVTASSHTHAITTTSVGAVNTIVQTDATGGTKLNNLMVGGDWKLEQVDTELLLKYNNLIAARFLADGSIVGLGEITAYGATTGGEGVSLLRTGGTMTGNLIMSADIIMNSDSSIGVSNLPLKLLGNALTYNASNVLTEANTATQIKMGNGWTIEQTVDSLTIRKDGVIKQTIPA